MASTGCLAAGVASSISTHRGAAGTPLRVGVDPAPGLAGPVGQAPVEAAAHVAVAPLVLVGGDAGRSLS